MSSILLVDDRLEFGEFQSVTARPSKRRSKSKATNLPQRLEDIRPREEQARCLFPSEKADLAVYHLCPLPTNLIIASQPILPVASLFVSTITGNQRRRLSPLLPKPRTATL